MDKNDLNQIEEKLKKTEEELKKMNENIQNRNKFDEKFSRISKTPWDKLSEKDKEYYIKNFGR